MEKISNLKCYRRGYSPSEFMAPHIGERDVWFPDNSAEETILDVGKDVLPNTIELLKNPNYATALHEFATEIESYETPIDTSNLTDEQLADFVSADKDLNTRFWEFYENARQRFEESQT